MSTVKFACPSCSQHLSCDDSAQGTAIQCPSCGQMVLVPNILVGVPLSQTPGPSSQPAQAGQAPPAASVSQIKGDKPTLPWLCEQCGAEFYAPYDYYGMSVECSYCHQSTKVIKQSNSAQEGQPGTAQKASKTKIGVIAQQKLAEAELICVFLGIIFAVFAAMDFILATYRDENQTKRMVSGIIGTFWTVFYILGGHLLNRFRSVRFAAVFFGVQSITLLGVLAILLLAILSHSTGEAWFSFFIFVIAAACFYVSFRALQVTLNLQKPAAMKSAGFAAKERQDEAIANH